MATNSNSLIREISWTEEPGRLQSMQVQRISHNLATKQQQLILEIRRTRPREGNVMPRVTQDVFSQMTSLGSLP